MGCIAWVPGISDSGAVELSIAYLQFQRFQNFRFYGCLYFLRGNLSLHRSSHSYSLLRREFPVVCCCFTSPNYLNCKLSSLPLPVTAQDSLTTRSTSFDLTMPAFNGKAPYAPDYASYNWIGAPANYALTTNKNLGGDSRTSRALPATIDRSF